MVSAQSIVNVTYSDAGDPMFTFADGTTTTYGVGNIAFMMIAAFLVMIMGPGVGYLYAGMLRQRSALSMLLLSLVVYATGTITWYFWGYSLAFSSGGSSFIGNLENFGLIGVLDGASGSIPVLLYFFYQSMFAAVTPVIFIGGFAERSRLLPVIAFTFCWQTVVYAPVARWVWSVSGWALKLGDIDFAGGGPVHMTSGASALAISLFLGKRRGYGTSLVQYRPQNPSHTFLGTTLLWFGWFGFNSGSELSCNLRSVNAAVVTNIAAAMGAITWMMIDYFKTKKMSSISFCSGCISGLVGITPAAGYVGAPAALAIGFLTAFAANYGTYIAYFLKIDDVLSIFATHGIAGFVGACLTGIFAEQKYSSLDGVGVGSGWPDHHYVQLGYNMATALAILSWSFTVSLILLYGLNFIPGLHFRPSEEDEVVGMDRSQIGEGIYAYDLVDLEESGITKAMMEERHIHEKSSDIETPQEVVVG